MAGGRGRSTRPPSRGSAPKNDGGSASSTRLLLAQRRRAIQRKAERGSGESASRATPIPEGSGAPLPGAVADKMEKALGAPLGAARVHTGSESAAAAKGLSARAFTDGNDVHFAAGQFQPGTPRGDRLIAHELTHVAQNQRSGASGAPMRAAEGHALSTPEDAAEKEADATADAVVAGRKVAAPAARPSGISRAEEGDEDEEQNAPPQGTQEDTEFGSFMVFPDGTAGLDPMQNQITVGELAQRKAAWDQIKAGTGGLVIEESADEPDFKAYILQQCGILMSRPEGASLLMSLFTGKTVTIKASPQRIRAGGAQASAIESGEAIFAPNLGKGEGSGSTVLIDRSNENNMSVFDERGMPMPSPMFITLGHELIHARHNQLGVNLNRYPANGPGGADPAKGYSNREEQSTIEGGVASPVAQGGPCENDLRQEQGLPNRKGHGGFMRN